MAATRHTAVSATTNGRAFTHVTRRIGQSALAVAAVVALTASTPAAATPLEEEGLWYFDRFKVQDAHDSGVTGEGVTIAIIDGQVNVDLPTLADADIRIQDPVCIHADGTRPSPTSADFGAADHGTAVLSLLVGSGEGFPGQTGVKGIAPDATVLTFYSQTNDVHEDESACPNTTIHSDYERRFGTPGAIVDGSDEIGQSIHAAIDAGADIISVSMGAADSSVLSIAVARAIREGVIIVGALPNEGVLWGGTAPASLNGVVSVNSFDAEGQAHGKEHTDVTGPGDSLLFQGTADGWQNQSLRSGTSLAAPIVAGNLALAMEKYPDATPNQLIQSLIHNTGAEPHDLTWDPIYGYGIVITDRFLAEDPTQYPDVNPLVSDFANLFPRVDDMWPDAVPSDQEFSLDDRPWPVYTPQAAPPESSPSASPNGDAKVTESPTANADTPSNSSAGWLVPAIVIGVVLLLVIAITITIVIVRTNRPTGGSHGSQ